MAANQNTRNSHFYTALALERRGNLAGALEAYREALKIDSSFIDGWLNSGVLFSKLSMPDKAVLCYETALKNGFDERVLYNLALERYKAGSFDEAVALLENRFEQIRQMFGCQLLLAYSYEKTGDYRKSEKLLLRLLKTLSDVGAKQHNGQNQLMETLGALILLYYKTGDFEQCEKFALFALQRDPSHPISAKVIQFLKTAEKGCLSKMHELRKEIQSDPLLKEISELNENDPGINERLSQKHSDLSQKKGKNRQDRLDLSLLSLFLGEGEEALDHLISAAI